MKKFPLIALRGTISTLLLAGLGVPALAQSVSGPLQGFWMSEGKTMIIQVASCGDRLCGTILRNLGADIAPGQAPASGKNGKTIVGWQILRDFVDAGNGDWKGQMHNAMDGRSYDCLMHLESSDRLWVRAYIGLPILGKDHHWQRLTPDDVNRIGEKI